MRKNPKTMGLAVVCFAAICLIASHDSPTQLHAQSKGKGGKKGGNVKQLDVRAQRLHSEFFRDSSSLARDYENSGELEKARQVYSALSKLNPKSTDIRDRLKKLDEAILSANEFDVEIDTSLGWGVPLARVTKGKQVQVQTSGSYRFQASIMVSPAGFPAKDPTKGDLAANIRCGALMGMVVANGKPGKPFSIGGGNQFTPRNGGLLYLRVNVPPGSKCVGKLTVRLSGEVARN